MLLCYVNHCILLLISICSLCYIFRASRLGVYPHGVQTPVPFRNIDEESKQPGVWGADQGSTSAAEASRDNLASLYRPPFALMYHGPFEKVIYY